MNETPDEPRRPDEDGRGQPDDPVDRLSDPDVDADADADPTMQGPIGESPPLHLPPPAGSDQPDPDASAEPDPTTQGPLGESPIVHEDEAPSRRRLLGGGRLVATGVVVLVLLGGGAALAVGGGDDDADDGVATMEGSDGGDGGTEDDDGGGGNGPVDESEMEDAMLEYVQCMRDHGIDMPDPEFGDGTVTMNGPGPGEADPEEMEAADEACQPILEEAMPDMPDLSPEELAERQDQVLAMAQCMRDRGYDFPDPEVNEDGGIAIGGGDPGEGGQLPGPGDEQFEQDMEECNEESGLGNPGEGELNSEDDGAST